MAHQSKFRQSVLATASMLILATCSTGVTDGAEVEAVDQAVNQTDMDAPRITPENWPTIAAAALDPEVEARITDIMSRMTLEQKVGQVIQGDTNSVTPEDVKTYRLGSILSGGNSAPGDKPYADTQTWLDAADAYFEASIDTDGVEVAIPIIWGIDAVHGHTNLIGGIVFPHNVGLGAANDPDLIHRISEITAIELNVSGHDWTFAPTLAVPQNDRWGRGYEGFSEDPAIVKSYGGEIVEGLQGVVGADEFMGVGRVISTAKHFLGDGGTQNGVDQGNAVISEAELRDIHLPGYETAISAGAQSVMASFSSWQGQPMHGQKELMTDVLKGRMNFQGFVVGDWNGHALIPDCTATDCPQSINAGLDMYMAPESWKGLYESTLRHVQSGVIPMERLDDAVRRILRVKINSGIFEKPKPSARAMAGETERLGSPEHRAIAREAVRKSQVLLKNNAQTLPLSSGSHVHIVGQGADSITKFSGGWTLSWQGRDHVNSDFPNGESFLQAVTREVEAGGGRVTFDPSGDTVPDNADAIIAVYGEDPYAEFQGDIETVDFVPNDFDTEKLAGYKASGVPVVSLFISGRPLWVNPELNDSDAFIAAWLPGSEPSGITDLLFQMDSSHDFSGRLSFSWPKTAAQVKLNPHHDNYDPLFALGYGLSLSDNVTMPTLSEDSGIAEGSSQKGVFFEKGASPQPWSPTVNGTRITLPFDEAGTRVAAFDMAAQEDALSLSFSDDQSVFSIASSYTLDYSREANGAMELSFMSRSLGDAVDVEIGAGCTNLEGCTNFHTVSLSQDWKETRIPLRCAIEAGVDMNWMGHAFTVKGQPDLDMAIADVVIKQESADAIPCGGE